MRLCFDIETNAKEVKNVTTVHSLCIQDVDTGGRWSCAKGDKHPPIEEEGLALLAGADVLIGHNILSYDLPALFKIFGWKPSPITKIYDTLTLSRLIWSDISGQLDKRPAPNFPAAMIGKHSLKSWGYRLGELKGSIGEEEECWSTWTPEMQAYCAQDVKVNTLLWKRIEAQNYSPVAIELEHEFQKVILQQEETGIRFNTEKAAALYAKLVKRREELADQLGKVFPPTVEQMKKPAYWIGDGTQFPTKGAAQKAKAKEIASGPPATKSIPFNPGSRLQISERLKAWGWVPTEFTPSGQPKVDEGVVASLPYPEAKVLGEYLLVGKRIGQVGEGDKAWLKLVNNSRIHGSVITNGCVTGRCTHNNPNMSQVPSVDAPYGKECRELFEADPGKVVVGGDASGLELRCLAHYMAAFDGGAYGKVLLEGDIHTANQQAAGLSTRNQAKTFIYAYLYGAGDEKLGTVAQVSSEEIEALKKNRTLWKRVLKMQDRRGLLADDKTVGTIAKGMSLRERFQDNTPALKQLKDAIKSAVKARGFLKGIDGRLLHIRSSHSALNTLLQSAGAILVKQATVFFHQKNPPCQQLLHVHDEIQVQCLPQDAEAVGKMMVQSFEESGRFFNFRVPITGEYKVGRNWAETH